MEINLYKIIVIGDSNVGKSAIINTYLHKNKIKPTIGIEYYTKIINLFGINFKIYIFDTSGNSKFYSFTKKSFDDTDGAFIVFDMSNENSFNNVDYWVNELKKKSNAYIILLGNKRNEQKISQNQIKKKIEELKLDFYEISLQTECIEYVFIKMIEKIYTKKRENDFYFEIEDGLVEQKNCLIF